VIKRILSGVFFAIAWTVLLQVLLCLPGSTLPSGGIFSIPQLDKIVHVILFGGLTAVWCYYYYAKGKPAARLVVIFFIVYLLAVADGIIMEFVQRDYIPNRSFDLADIVADILACSIAYGICNIKLLKTTA
jgi:VanZ family protein